MRNHIITSQSGDLTVAKKGATKRMNLTAPIAKLPWSTTKETVDALGDERNHHTKIRDGQVHKQQISRGAQRLETTKNSQYHCVAQDCHTPYVIVVIDNFKR